MTVLDYLVSGLEAELELERELGVRTVDCDRALLTPVQNAPRSASAAPLPAPTPSAPEPTPEKPAFDFVFLHDKPLTEGAAEIMAKIIPAMGKTPETAPIVCGLPIPRAKVYVLLGRGALRKFIPDAAGSPGMWIKTPRGQDALITYSPEHFLRFPTVTDTVVQQKREMWQNLKSVLQHVRM